MPEALPVNAAELLNLARSEDVDSRHRLLLGMAELCALKPLGQGRAGAASSEIMLILTRKAELEVRARLAERLAETPWAPHELIIFLAHDAIEVASPVIQSSPVLKEDDLLKIAETLTEAHRISLAGRPGLRPSVSQALIDRTEPSVLSALLNNESAQISEDGLAQCASAAESIDALWTPLAKRADLPESIARIAIERVGAALREDLMARFPNHQAGLKGEIAAAAEQACADEPDDANAQPLAARLVDKLAKSERLTPSFVMKSLNEGKMELVDHALAKLCATPVVVLKTALDRRQAKALALACHAAGLDRSVFPSVVEKFTLAKRLTEALTASAVEECGAVFDEMSRESAAAGLRRMGANA